MEILTSDNKFSCSTCLESPKDPLLNKTKRERMHCFDLKQGKHHYKFLNLEYKWCIGNYYSEYAREIIDLYFAYEKGIMPYRGALTDQPAKAMEAFRIIEYYKSEYEKATKKKNKSKI